MHTLSLPTRIFSNATESVMPQIIPVGGITRFSNARVFQFNLTREYPLARILESLISSNYQADFLVRKYTSIFLY